MFLAAGACGVGEIPLPDGGGGGGGGGGGQSFNAQIKPLVTRCATAACHSGPQPPNLTSFDLLAAKYRAKPGSTNPLVIKAADGVTHNGVPYFSAAEKATVITWVDSLP